MGDDAGRLLSEAGDGPAARPWLAPAVLLAVALVVRVGAAWQTAAIFNDGPSFLRVAALFYEGHTAMAFGHSYHPLYPLLVSVVAPWLGDFARAGVVVSVVAGSLAVLPLYAFLLRAFGRQPAVLGGLLFAFHPYAAIQSADVQSEGLYFALFLSALALSWRAAEDAAPGWAALAGIVTGATYLVRPEGLGVAAVTLCFAALLLFQGRFGVPAFLRLAAALSVGVAVVAGPYVVHLHQVTGRWMLTQKKSMADFASPPSPKTPSLDGPDRERFRPPSLAPPSRRPPARRAGLLPARIDVEPRQLSAAVELVRVSIGALHPLVALLVLVGVLSVRGPPGDRGRFLLLVVGLYGVLLYGLAFGVGYLDRRHVLAPLLPLLGYGGLGLPRVGRGLLRLARPRADARDAEVAAGLGLALVVLVTLPKTWAPHREERLANRRAAEWLRSRDDLTGAVAAEKYRTAWYAGEAFVRLDRAAGGVEDLTRAGARFLIVDDVAVRAWPDLDARRATLLELYRVEAAGRTAFVYALAPLARAGALGPGAEPPAQPAD